MNPIEKRDFIHSHLHEVDERLINEFYEILRKEEVLKSKLINRAQQSENDIKEGKVYSRNEVEEKKSIGSNSKAADFINKWSGVLSNPETDEANLII